MPFTNPRRVDSHVARRAPAILFAGCLSTFPLAAAASAQTATAVATVADAGRGDQPTMKRLSVEELSQIDVTSVSKHAESVSDAAAAIIVITQDDIRRAGIQTLPEALRLATGVAVARFDGRTWAISARGFNISTANKMAVFLDGRSLYTPLFSGVFWDVQDVVLDDIERIEVIRGPGGTLWGANAVNGVINIITKASADTVGALVQVGGGNELGKTAIRYGGTAGRDKTYRVYAKYRYADQQVFDTGAGARDRVTFGQAGFRLDSALTGRTVLTLQGDIYGGRSGISDRPDSSVAGGNTILRVLRTFNSGSQMQLQAYYDGTYRHVPRQFMEHRDTADLEVQYRRSFGRRHDVIAGGGYQVTIGRTRGSQVLFFDPAIRTSTVGNVFVQDTVAIVPGRLSVIAGSKIEHNDYTGIEYQPNARIKWTPHSRETVWAAVSRAVRMPTRFDTDLRFTGLSPVVLLRGDAGFVSETVIAGELGYRRQVHPRLALDVAGFLNDYDDLRTQEPSPLPIVLANRMVARTGGVEVTADYQATPSWQLHAAYALLSERFRLRPNSRDISNGTAEHNDPRHQWSLRSFLDLPRGSELDATFRFVGELATPPVPRYGELTLHLAFRRGQSPEFGVVGDNLLHAAHPEFGNLTPREEFERSVFGQVTWRF